jgi:hypothetical protein
MKNPFRECIQLVQAMQRAQREGRTGEFVRAAKESAEIQKTMMRPLRHETVNGAGEIGWGMFLLCCSLACYISSGGPWMWQLRTAASCLLMIGALVAMPLCRWTIKKYVTWPRTGYVACRRGGIFWISTVLSVVIAVAGSIWLSRLMQPEIARSMAAAQARHAGAATPGAWSAGTMSFPLKAVLAGMGPMNALLYLMMNAVSIKEHRWKWVLSVLIALGPPAICFFVPGNYVQVARPVMLFLGLACFGSGAATLYWFIRRHQPPAPEPE